MTHSLHIACLQTRPMATMPKAIDEALPMAEAAAQAGAKVIFLPEYCGGLASDGARLCPPSAPDNAHPFLAALQEFARRRGVWVNIGSIAVDGPDGKLLNRGYMISDTGDVAGRYDKIHLFDVDLTDTASYRESDTVQPGTKAVIHNTPLAAIGHTICYDLRFGQLYRELAQSGAQILCCPAAFTKLTGEAHWHVLNRARAIENTRFVVSACAVGPVPGGGESYGHSLVVGPWGDVLADGSTFPGVVHAQLDLDQVPAMQHRVPSLEHDRPFRLATSKTSAKGRNAA